jgi:hypothetical protein
MHATIERLLADVFLARSVTSHTPLCDNNIEAILTVIMWYNEGPLCESHKLREPLSNILNVGTIKFESFVRGNQCSLNLVHISQVNNSTVNLSRTVEQHPEAQ